ncbi:MAG: YgdI/YgdR family lipoprotein [Nanoarchaeota archaeon]|nr:YgdI/YgdR family lipoprotein [Nanoarchaeota archaeon]
MKRIMTISLLLLILGTVFLIGCESVDEGQILTTDSSVITTDSMEEAEIDDSLTEFDDLDSLEAELDFDFAEVEGYFE